MKEEEVKKADQEKEKNNNNEPVKQEIEKKEEVKENKPEKTVKNEEEKKEETKKEKKKKEININSQEYVDQMLKKKKRRIIIGIVAVVIILFSVAFSTVFAITTMMSDKIIHKIKVNSIEVSGLSQKDAKEKIEEELKDSISQKLQFKYEDFSSEFTTDDIKTKYKIEEAVQEAFNKGRDENIIKNNFNVLKSFFVENNIQIEAEYNKEEVKNIVKTMANNIPGKVTDYTYCIEEDELIITPGKAGKKLDEEKTMEIIDDRIVNISSESNKDTIELPVYDSEPDEIDIEKIYKEIYTEPQDAYIVQEPFKLVVDVDGVDFAITMEEAKAILKEKKEEYIIPLKIQKANKTVNDLGEEAFPKQLSTFTTIYDASNINRTNNLAIATSKINGKVLMPGEVFSYNKTLGKRSVENGYKEAAIYSNGKVENGLGGGICQISSTLYNAAVMANLEIVDRTNHMFVTSYAEPSRDATVVYGSIDFQFKNTRKYPVKIVASVNNGVAAVSFYGIPEEQEYEIRITNSRTGTIPCEVEEIPDPDLPAGETVVEQNGHNGCTSVAYKEIYLNGEFVSRELLSSDTYSAMKRIVRVGTQAAAPVVAEPVAPVAQPDPVQEQPVVTTEPVQTTPETPVETEPVETPGEENP